MFPPPFSLPLRGTFEIVTACGGNLTIKNAGGWHSAGVTEGVKRAIPYSLKNLGYFSFWFSSISATTPSA